MSHNTDSAFDDKMSALKETIGRNIQKYRKQKGITQVELAEKLNVKNTAVSTWETKGFSSDVGTVEKVCNVLGVSYDELRGKGPEIKLAGGVLEINRISVVEARGAGEQEDKKAAFLMEPGEAEEDFFAVYLRGDGYGRLRDGDIVLIRKQGSAESGDLIAALYDGEALLAGFKKYGDLIVLQAAGAGRGDIVVEPRDRERLRILGCAVAFQGGFCRQV